MLERTKKSPEKLTPAKMAVAVALGIVAISIIAASMKTSDRATMAVTVAAEAPNRFLAAELALLKGAAIRGDNRIAARLYFGIEECFKSTHPVPFDPENLEPAQAALEACARNQIGALHVVGGPAMASAGETFLRSLGVLR